MRKVRGLTWDTQQEEAARLLTGLGLSRPVARALLALARVDEATSADLEELTGLRQPEVSIAMQQLRERAWAAKRDERREGKGRPTHCYRLVVRLEDVLDTLEREKRTEAERNERALHRLRELAVDQMREPAPLA